MISAFVRTLGSYYSRRNGGLSVALVKRINIEICRANFDP